MKINELMIDNLMIFEGKPFKVSGINPPYVDMVGNGNRNRMIMFDMVNDNLQPIPITEEFLKANGFVYKCILEPLDNYTTGLYEWEKEVDGYYLSISNCSNHKDCDWNVHIDNNDRCSIGSADIQYVHQLQNFLSVLNIEMEVKA